MPPAGSAGAVTVLARLHALGLAGHLRVLRRVGQVALRPGRAPGASASSSSDSIETAGLGVRDQRGEQVARPPRTGPASSSRRSRSGARPPPRPSAAARRRWRAGWCGSSTRRRWCGRGPSGCSRRRSSAPRSSFHHFMVTCVGQAPLELATERDGGPAGVDERPARLDRHEDVDAPAAGRLRGALAGRAPPAAPARAGRRGRRRRSRCRAAGPGRCAAGRGSRRRRRAPATGGTSACPGWRPTRRRPARSGATSSAVRPLGNVIRAVSHVVRGALRDALLVERVARGVRPGGQLGALEHALGPALQRGRPVQQRAEDAVADGHEVLDDVELGQPALAGSRPCPGC